VRGRAETFALVLYEISFVEDVLGLAKTLMQAFMQAFMQVSLM